MARDSELIPMHKRIAAGQRVTGMKHGGHVKAYAKGGAVHSDVAEDKKLIKKMVKKGCRSS